MILNLPTIPLVMPLTEAVFVSKYSGVISKVRVWIYVCRLQQGHRIRFSFCTRPWFFTDSYSEVVVHQTNELHSYSYSYYLFTFY
jgi:hypothetical protein